MARFELDFLRDLDELAEAELQTEGIKKPRANHPVGRKVARQYEPGPLTRLLTVEHRRIPPRPRQTIWSDILRARSADSLLEAAKRLASESEEGKDLSHFLGRGVVHSEPDWQFNDWGIAHLHLGARQPEKPLSIGTKDLLFVLPTFDRVYFIDLGDHRSFEDVSLFETVHRNWPEVLEESRAPNVIKSYLPAASAAKLRSAGFITMTTTKDGTPYLPHGMGQTFNGVSLKVGLLVDQMKRSVFNFQSAVARDEEALWRQMAALGPELPPGPIQIRLKQFGAKSIATTEEGAFWLSWDGVSTILYTKPRLSPER